MIDPATDEIAEIDQLVPGRHTVGGPYSLAADPTRPRIFCVAAVDGTLEFVIFNAPERRASAMIPLPPQTPTSGGKLAVGANGDKIYVPGMNSVLVVSTVSKSIVQTIPLPSQPGGLAIADGDLRVFAPLPDRNEVAIINTATSDVKVVRAGSCGSSSKCRPRDVAASPDQTLVVFTGRLSNGFVMDAKTETVVGQLPIEAQHVLGVDPSRNSVWVDTHGCCQAEESEISLKPPFNVLNSFGFHGWILTSAAFSASGQGLAVSPVGLSRGFLIPSPFSNDPARYIHVAMDIDEITYAP